MAGDISGTDRRRREKRMSGRILVGVVAIIGGILSLALIGAGYKALSFAHENAAWPTVTGTLREIRVQELDESGKTEFSLFLDYAYEVDGRDYTGHVLSSPVMPRFPTRREAEELIAPYEAGEPIAVHYDPDDPSRSCLVPGDAGEAWIMLLMGFALALGVGYIIFGSSLVGLVRKRFTDRGLNITVSAPWGWSRRPAEGPLAEWRKGRLTCALNAGASSNSVLESPESVAATRQHRITTGAEDHELIRNETHSAHGHDGVLIEIVATRSRKRIRYTAFCAAGRGFERELLVYGPADRLGSEESTRILDRFLAGMKVIDPERSSYALQPPARLPWSSNVYGYTFAPRTSKWRQWRSVKSESATAEYGFLHEAALSLSILPIRLPEEGPPADALHDAFLKRFGLQLGGADVERVERADDKVVFSCVRELTNVSYAYRFHVRTWLGGAALLALIGEPGNPALDEVIEEAVDAFEPPEKSPSSFDASIDDTQAIAREADILGGIGLWFFHRNRNEEARTYLAACCERTPQDVDAFLYLLRTYAVTERYEEGLQVLSRGRKHVPDNLTVASFGPFFLSKLGRKDEAIAAYEEVFDRGWRDESDAREYVEILVKMDRHEEAMKRIDSFRKAGDEVWVRRLASRVLRAQEKPDEALSQIRQYVEAHPEERHARIALVQELVACDRGDEAVELCEKHLGDSPSDVEFLFERGVAECHLGRYPHAKRSFEAALKISPQSSTISEWLRHAESELGQGSHQLLRRPIPALDLPPWDTPDQKEMSGFSEEPLVHLDSTIVYEYRKDESIKWTERDVTLIRTRRGAEEMSTRYVPFDPEGMEVHVNEVRVRNSDGKTIWTGHADDYFVRDDASDEGSHKKIVHVPVVGLAPGCTLEFVRSFRLHGSPSRFYDRRVVLGRRNPVLRSVVEVRGDVEPLAARTTGDIKEARKEGRIRFTARRLPGFPREPHAPRIYRWAPTVWLTESEDSWEKVAKEYLQRIEDRLETPPAIAALAAEITETACTAEERAAAVVNWVRDNLSYKSLAFGPRAWMPERADKVAEARWGDCKGHSILLYHLMRAVGDRCHLALVSTSDDIWPERPSSWQFDHMINFCPDFEGGRFIDAVDKGAGLDAIAPTGLAGQTALVLDPDDPRLVALPTYPPEANRVECDRECICASDGSLHVSEVLTVKANLGGYLRRWLASATPAERKEKVIASLHRLDQRLHLEDLIAEHVDDANGPVTLRMRYRIPRALEDVDGKLIGALPALWERDYLVPPISSDRRAPVEIEMPYVFETRVRVQARDGEGRVTLKGSSQESGEGPFLVWDRQISTDADGLVLHFQGSTRTGLHPPESYEEFRSATLAALEALEARVLVT